MNAYELADELENYVWMNPNNNRDYCKEVKDMLRQQADRIGVLEANYKLQLNILKKQRDYIDQLEQGLRASIDLNKAQAERFAELERKHKEEFDYAEKLLKEQAK